MTSRPQFSLFVAGRDNRGPAAHAAEGCRRFKTEFPGLGRDQVRDLMNFEMPPHIFDRIEFGRVSREPFDHDAPPGGSHVVFDQRAAMDRGAIPDDQHLPSNVPFEVSQKLDHLRALDAAGLDLEIETPEGQTANDRKAFPVEGLVEHRGLPTRGPGARPRRASAQSALVHKDDDAPLPAGLFFNVGQPTRFHRRIAFSSRSIARRSGRWQLNPLAPSNRQT